MEKKVRYLLLLFLILVIAGTCVYTYKNKDTLFITFTEIEYPEGCIEKYKGTELVTPECTEGRIILEKAKQGLYNSADRDYTITGMNLNWNKTNQTQ